MKAKQWPRRMHNAPKTEEEKDVRLKLKQTGEQERSQQRDFKRR
jgi:hypothetical protein